MTPIWIIGAGHFGRHAADGLSRARPGVRLLLVDPCAENLARARGPRRCLEEADGVPFLAQRLGAGDEPEWIVPAVPLHLAVEWCLARLDPGRFRRRPVPPEAELLLPNPMGGPLGDLYVSHARFRCPSDCPEPEDLCTVTRKPRERNLFEVLGELKVPAQESLVVRSHQLGAGIGGYRPAQLLDLLVAVERGGERLLVSTACRCHGVLTALERVG
ncbi:MAG: potassium transporter [Deltaproteobacteria bacterium]|nr:potassium transporter [Deltaproteobacteria bacterium]